jgi:hypothetical protein
LKEIGGSLVLQLTNQPYLIKEDDLTLYLEHTPLLQKETDTQVWYPGYYEHVVQFEGTRPGRFMRRNEDVLSVSSPW